MKKLVILFLLPTLLFNCSEESSDDVPPVSTCDNGTFTGIVRLRTQAEVNEFGALCYSKIDGTLVIGPSDGVVSDILDLHALSNLNEVFVSQSGEGTGKLIISNTSSLVNLRGLDGLTKVAGIIIVSNSGLIDFTGLEGITELSSPGVFNDLVVSHNSQLQSFHGLHNLTAIGSQDASDETITFMNIQGNTNLTNFDSLANLESIYGSVTIGSFQEGSNPELGNPNLTDYCGLTNLLNSNTFEYVNIFNNAFNPSNQDIINGNCSQ